MFIGLMAVSIVGWCSQTMYHTDPMIQVVVTICCAYASFIIAEDQQLPFGTSGVLTVVCAGAVFAHYGQPRFVSRETIHTIWEAIEFVGNTTIFLLAGLLFGHRVLIRHEHLTPRWSLVLRVVRCFDAHPAFHDRRAMAFHESTWTQDYLERGPRDVV
jgi:NhaP-type Na+/H+ or K+/H+ antiporter